MRRDDFLLKKIHAAMTLMAVEVAAALEDLVDIVHRRNDSLTSVRDHKDRRRVMLVTKVVDEEMEKMVEEEIVSDRNEMEN